MTNQSKSDVALRKALSNMAQRQPSPPEGMAERFIARLATEQVQEKEQQAIVQHQGAPRRTLRLVLRWTSVAAAVVVAAAIVWRSQTEDTTSSTLQPIQKTSTPAMAEAPALPITTTTAPKAEMAAKSESLKARQPITQQTFAQQASEQKPIRTVQPVQQLAEVQQNQVKEEMPAPISIPRFVLDNMQGTPATGLIAVHSQNNPSSLKRREVNQNQITERMPMPIPVSGLVWDNMQGTPATGLIAVNSQNNPFTSGRIEVKPTVTAQHDVTANFTLAERRLDARAEQADYRAASLIVGERLAVERIILREKLSALPDAFKTKETKQQKPIRI